MKKNIEAEKLFGDWRIFHISGFCGNFPKINERAGLLRYVRRNLEEMCEKGSVMALSDVGAGAALLQGALKAASLNIYINAGSMKNRERAQALLFETEDLLSGGESLAQKIFDEVRSRLLHE